MIAASGLGVLLISFVKNMRQTGFVLGGVLSVLGMLSGLFTANIDMPEAFNKLANFTPQGWVLQELENRVEWSASGRPGAAVGCAACDGRYHVWRRCAAIPQAVCINIVWAK